MSSYFSCPFHPPPSFPGIIDSMVKALTTTISGGFLMGGAGFCTQLDQVASGWCRRNRLGRYTGLYRLGDWARAVWVDVSV